MSLLTIRGLYNYDPGIFDGLEIPDFWDRDTLIDCILERCEEREVLYSAPVVMADHIRHWGNSNLVQWRRLAKALQVEYEPLENFDRHEEYTDKSTDKGTGTSNSESTGKATGYNSGSLVAVDGSESSANTDTLTEHTSSHTGRLHGNIGVTTSQQMLQSEIDLRRWNWYYETADDFRERFTLGVW